MLIEITNRCNEGCPHCFNSSFPNGGMMSETVFKNAVAFAVRNKMPLIYLSGGEPFLHPNIGKWVRYIGEQYEKRRIALVLIITTNGTWCLDEKSLKRAKNIINSQYVSNVIVNTNKKYYQHYEEVCSFFEKNVIPKTELNKDWQGEVTNMIKLGRANNLDFKILGHPHCIDSSNHFKKFHGESLPSILLKWAKKGHSCSPAVSINGDVRIGPSRFCKPIFNVNKKEPADLCSMIENFEPCNKCGRMKYFEGMKAMQNIKCIERLPNIQPIERRRDIIIEYDNSNNTENVQNNIYLQMLDSIKDSDDRNDTNELIYLYSSICLFVYCMKSLDIDNIGDFLREDKQQFQKEISSIKKKTELFKERVNSIHFKNSTCNEYPPYNICEEFLLDWIEHNTDFIKNVDNVTRYFKKKYARFGCEKDFFGILVSVIKVIYDRYGKYIERSSAKDYYSNLIEDILYIYNHHKPNVSEEASKAFDEHEKTLVDKSCGGNSMIMNKETKPIFDFVDYLDLNFPRYVVQAMIFYGYAEPRIKH